MSISSIMSRSENDVQSPSKSSCITTTLASDMGQSKGYYDAEKCRAHIANQIKVSKIDRFAAQINKAQEIELEIQSKIREVLEIFVQKSARTAYEFVSRCKSGLLHESNLEPASYKTKRIKRMKKKANLKRRSVDAIPISKDLYHGVELRMILDLLSGQPTFNKALTIEDMLSDDDSVMSGFDGALSLDATDINLINLFKPTDFIDNLKDHLKSDRRKSQKILDYLTSIKQLFEKLASEHRLNVDLVYAAEEERQSATVIRRSSYNLSLAAIKATSTPVHVTHVTTNNDSHIL